MTKAYFRMLDSPTFWDDIHCDNDSTPNINVLNDHETNWIHGIGRLHILARIDIQNTSQHGQSLSEHTFILSPLEENYVNKYRTIGFFNSRKNWYIIRVSATNVNFFPFKFINEKLRFFGWRSHTITWVTSKHYDSIQFVNVNYLFFSFIIIF